MEVEVRGLTDAVDTEFLVLYLESRRHSGGGPISSYSRTGSQALVTFENPSDAENVLCKEQHVVQSVNIHVRRLPPWDPGKVALCGLHPEAEECLLELYVENVSGREGFLLLRSADRRTVVVAFHQPLSDEEFNRLETSVQKRSVHGSWPSVQHVRLCAEVLVENVGNGISQELLEMYFESHRSGGGRVNSLTMLRNNSTAIVSFSDVSVAARVLSRSHSLQDCQLAVSPYYLTLMGSPNAEETGPQEGNRSEGPQGEEGRGNELQELQTDMGPEDEIDVQDWHEEARSDPVIMDLSEDPSQGAAVKDQMKGQQEAEIPEGVMAEDPPMVAVRDEEARVSSDTGTSVMSLQEAEVLMNSSELRFMQDYQNELLAGMDQVTIVPLEAEDRCGFKVAGDAVSCKTTVELLSHMVSSLSSRTVTLQYPGVSLFLLEEEGQRAVLEMEQQQHCIIDMSHLSWKVARSKQVDPWSFVHTSDTSPVQQSMDEELSEAAGTRLAADIEDIKVFASLLESSQNEVNKGETVEWKIKQEDYEVDLYTDNSAKSQDEGSFESEDEELDQACKMSRDEFQNERLDEAAQLLLAIQMSMDTQSTTMEDEDKALQQALELSLREHILEEVEEPLQRALEMSLQNPWPYETTHAQDHVDVSGNEIEKALNTAQITVLAQDETSLVVASAAIRKAVTGRLCTVTLNGVDNFHNKAEILSALEKKHMVAITVHEGQAQIHGFLQNPLKCQEELSLILDALHAGSRSQAGPMTLDPLQTIVLIPVSDSSEEYKRVVQEFLGTLHELRSVTQVLQVQKLQNALLYNQYQLKKQSMLAQRPGTHIERTLYHGTTENGAKEICHHGFDRSFCGKNATFYGHGVYFAVEAAISARDKYSPPSGAGNKYILVAQVLTGEFAVGKEDMKTPPIKPGTVGEVPQRYDSLVDHLQSPAIFVIFNDTQAYPQYLITCCNNRDSGN